VIERPVLRGERVTLRPLMRRYERGADGTFHDGLPMDRLADEFVDG